MRASLIIAARDEGDRLWRTAASCLRTAAGLDCELIVADDASTDGSVAEVRRRFPTARHVGHRRPLGVGPARAAGARAARGEVLVFLDGHCHPEPGAVERLVADVEGLGGTAVVTPRLAVLDAAGWENSLLEQVGYGFLPDLETHERFWVDPGRMRAAGDVSGRRLFECPAPAGCCLAVHRRLYDRLLGFDRGMRGWGSEDLDFGLKAWLTGHPVLIDPSAVVGHWFRGGSGADRAQDERVVANQLRLARKHYGDAAWHDWLRRCRCRHPGLSWSEVWRRFERHRAGLERERASLMARRMLDEFWYAERFGLWWPLWLAGREPDPHWGEHQPDGPDELFEAHSRHPRNRGLWADPCLVGTARYGGGSALTVALSLTRRRSGELCVGRAGFEWEGEAEPAALACTSWLTTRVEGEPLAHARSIGPAEVGAALGLEGTGAAGGAAEAAVAALRAALGRL